jgi:hypothetical protein
LPYANYIPGSLILQSLNNTNTFGYWSSRDSDITVNTSPTLYRAKFTIHTDVEDRTEVPRFRMRMGLGNNAAIATRAIDSVDDSEMSPFFDFDNPGKLFDYYLYFFKPQTQATENLFLAFDILSFSLSYANPASLIIDNVKVEELATPAFPTD